MKSILSFIILFIVLILFGCFRSVAPRAEVDSPPKITSLYIAPFDSPDTSGISKRKIKLSPFRDLNPEVTDEFDSRDVKNIRVSLIQNAEESSYFTKVVDMEASNITEIPDEKCIILFINYKVVAFKFKSADGSSCMIKAEVTLKDKKRNILGKEIIYGAQSSQVQSIAKTKTIRAFVEQVFVFINNSMKNNPYF